VLPGLTAATRVSLRFFGTFDGSIDVSEALGCAPTKFHQAKGELPGSWILSGADDRRPLDEQVQALFAGLPNDLGVWRGMSARFRIDLFCGLFVKGFNSMADLSSNSLRILADRGIKLTLDMYCNDED